MNCAKANEEINRSFVKGNTSILVDVFHKQISYYSFCYDKMNGEVYQVDEIVALAKKKLMDAVMSQSTISREPVNLDDYECIVTLCNRGGESYNFTLSVTGDNISATSLRSVLINIK